MLSLTNKRWVIPEATKSINASHVLARLFASRSIDPDATLRLVPPSIFPDMDRAVQRINQAIDREERIGIFGDYDCDGITAVAQLRRFFARRGAKPYVRLPHRVRDGYGLSKAIVQELIDADVTLLITADTGISSVAEIALLKESDIDTIITDHHHVSEEVPPAFAIIHPSLSAHPEPHPSGAGVVYKLIHALEGSNWDGMESDAALAMIGTVADLVPLRGDNRALTILGLQSFEKISTGPLSELRERCRSKDGVFSARDIAFRVAPRINAAGRIDEPEIALNALLEGGDALAYLDLLNEQRQNLSRELIAKALREIDEDTLAPILTSVSGDYPHGIVGLIAGKLTETYGRPSMVAHTDGVMCTASLRSPPCYNIAEGLGRCSAYLESFGGHAQAAGCSFSIKHLDALRSALEDDVATHVPADLLVPTLTIDAEIDAADVTLDFCNQLKHLEPFGQGNTEPLFLIRDVSLAGFRTCGKEDAHLQGKIRGVKCIGFQLGNFAQQSEKVDIVGRLNINEWNGKREAQLIIEDIAVAVSTQEPSSLPSGTHR